MSAPVVTIDGVWKAYPRYRSGPRTMRAILSRRVPGLVRSGDNRWALRDVTLHAAQGEQVGIVGANGAGKSTLLRLASGLGRPTAGTIQLPERSASVLNLGDTFDFELTGRENALTAGIVAGLHRQTALERMDAIFDFAELEGFEDAPMRTYSDGMRLRLAFGVIAQLEPQALLLDEVIAVGDVRFQAKCMERVAELRAGGAAVLFASHSLDQVAEVCDRVIWLQAGGVRASGEAATVVAEYKEAMRSDTLDRTPSVPEGEATEGDLELRRNRFGSQELRIAGVTVTDGGGAPTDEVASGDSVTIELELEGDDAVEEPIVGVAIHRVSDGLVCVDVNSETEGLRLGTVRRATVTLDLDRLELLPGDYTIDVGVYTADWSYAYDYHWQAYPLRVSGRGGGQGVVRPAQRWRAAT